jgi:hypothetical protein
MPGATYPLREIRKLVAGGRFYITRSSLDGAFGLGLDDQDIVECICDHLDEAHFYKTMSACRRPGLMQDVYRITYQGESIYLKLQIVSGSVTVISFKADESA